MPETMNDTVCQAVGLLLTESYEGVQGDGTSWYVDSGPQGCLLGLLASLPAEMAVRPPGAGRKSIAQHARHARFHLEATRKSLTGDRSPNNWDESWTVDARDEASWRREIEAMRTAYETVKRTCGQTEWDALKLASAIGTVAHAAYHLGAIRQMLKQPAA